MLAASVPILCATATDGGGLRLFLLLMMAERRAACATFATDGRRASRVYLYMQYKGRDAATGEKYISG